MMHSESDENWINNFIDDKLQANIQSVSTKYVYQFLHHHDIGIE